MITGLNHREGWANRPCKTSYSRGIEKTAYLKEYTGYDDEPEGERVLREARDQTPEAAKTYVRKLQREIFHLWGFIFQEGLHDEAYAFVNEHADEEIPFEW